MAMVILSYALCLSLGASIGFLCAGLCAAASDKAQHPIKRYCDADGQESSFEQVRGKSDASYATANRAD